MDFNSVGVSTLQGGFPSNAFPDLLPNLFANSTGEQTLQQHQDQNQSYQQQHQQQQQAGDQAKFFFGQNLPQLSSPLEQSRPGFVAPSALSSAPAAPSFAATLDSPASSVSAWQDSPASNPLSPPTSISSGVSPPIDPAIINFPKQEIKAEPATTQPATTQPAESTEAPSGRRGRPRLSDTKSRTTTTKEQQKRKATTIAAARRASNASSADDHHHIRAGAADPDEKRDRVRARNREAAYKCRKKKQKGIAELQSQEAVVENIHRNLTAEATALRGEILMLKNMVLQHGGCGCSYIEEYISGAAQNLVQSSMAAAAAASTSAQGGGEAPGFDGNANQPPCAGSEGFVDWKMIDVERRNGMSAFGSESNFSALDDVSVTHSSRAQSQGATAM
ncbi:bZIP transcription factor [Colletotrichum plurivorum]|uniref:BZIP transcription factor n=1 Tax=Colletotrichum plurivorum TaxID=2175906 RepID=A0A8H6N120_9PEZI|nr:bZIP transcription factor [Colletotrichum plurivorum]